MATFYILVMVKNADSDFWRVSKRASLIDELRKLRCYDDPPCEVLPKRSYPGTWQEDVKVPRCADMTIADDGTIYKVQGV